MNTVPKDCLGDSVYAEQDDFGSIVLTTGNGYGQSNIIILEPSVLIALENYMQRCKHRNRRRTNHEHQH